MPSLTDACRAQTGRHKYRPCLLEGRKARGSQDPRREQQPVNAGVRVAEGRLGCRWSAHQDFEGSSLSPLSLSSRKPGAWGGQPSSRFFHPAATRRALRGAVTVPGAQKTQVQLVLTALGGSLPISQTRHVRWPKFAAPTQERYDPIMADAKPAF